MKKFKFLRPLIYVVFSLLLVFTAVLPCFAVEPRNIGGGSGSSVAGSMFSVPLTYNVFYPEHPTTFQPFVFSFSFDPLFNALALSNTTTSIMGSDTPSIITDSPLSNVYNNFSYIFSQYSGDSNVFDGGSVSCTFNLYSSCEAQYDVYNTTLASQSISFYCPEFYAWSDPIEGHYTEFSIVIDLDLSFGIFPSYYLENYYVSFNYVPLGAFYSQSEFTYVELPLSDFIDETNNQLIISLDSFFANLDEASYYLVTQFNFRCSAIDYFISLNGDISITYNPDVYDVFTLYPSPAEKMDLHDYTDWIAHAVEGFMSLQIFPGFYLSGFLLVVLGFSMFVWALKVFAGG